MPDSIRDHVNGKRADQRTRNRRTGLLLGAVALAFFLGVILKHIYFG